ncbi:energy transducer TonB [Aliagarivorans taiwanensis]|uniref:energy transducer TonB n=1 Tax=Aliagarivorans taiwanensis TaxID=561966 RepID=UPI0003F611E7|nr:energy transducer TonB [Aliagarivorans taiwanensis]
MGRLLLALPLATVSCLGLFVFMSWMVDFGREGAPEQLAPVRFDMFMIENEQALQRRQRSVPDRPEPPMTPPEPQSVTTSINQQVAQSAMPDLPSLAMDAGVSGLAISLPPVAAVAQNQQVMPLQRIEPRYPQRALQRNVEGYVVLSFTIDEKGSPTDIQITESEPGRIFDREAIRALERWKYQPMVVDGVATPRVGQTVKLEFKIQA